MANVSDLQADKIAAAQLAVDSQVEAREFPYPALHLQPNAQRPDVLDLEGRLTQLYAYAKTVKDKETTGLLDLVSFHGDRISDLVGRMRSEAEPDIRQATAIVSTTHRAKGLEFRQVRVPEDDFAALLDNQGRQRAMTTPEQIEELNLYYVAMTRATHHFRPSAELMAALLEIPTAMRQADALQLVSSELKATPPPANRPVPPAGDAIRAL